jgi:hypothetical protein
MAVFAGTLSHRVPQKPSTVSVKRRAYNERRSIILYH